MPTSDRDRDKLDDYRQMMGPEAGNLALVLDTLTDIMALVAQHKVYCRIEKGPRAGEGTLDIEQILDLLGTCKDLVRPTLTQLSDAPSTTGDPP